MFYIKTFFYVIFVYAGIIENESIDICSDGWVPHGRSCYFFTASSPVHFTEAEHFCRQRGGHLVTVESSEENAFIKDFLRRLAGHNYWMGLSDDLTEGVWRWLTNGSTPTFTDWQPGHPNNYHNKQDCAHFYYSFDYKWEDTECTANNLPLCEKSKMTAEIIG